MAKGDNMRTRIRAVVLVAAMAVGASACGDSFGVEDMHGVWEAISVNGSDVPGSVPIHVGSDTETMQIDHDRLTLSDGNTCTIHQSVDGSAATIDECEWVLDVDAKRITIELFGSFSGSGPVSGSSITMSWPNEGGDPNVVVYQKQ